TSDSSNRSRNFRPKILESRTKVEPTDGAVDSCHKSSLRSRKKYFEFGESWIDDQGTAILRYPRVFNDRKRICVICGESSDEREMRSASATKVQNAILLACLSACGGLKENADARTIHENCHENRKFLCHPHYVLAAQFIASEMESVGKQFQYFIDPYAAGSKAYVCAVDIPPHIVEFVNNFMTAKKISGSNIHKNATAKDICHFMSTALRRYHATPLWPMDAEVSAVRLPTDSSNNTSSYTGPTDEAPSSSLSETTSFSSGPTTDSRQSAIDAEKTQTECIVCGDQFAAQGFRISSSSRIQNAIFITGLIACGCCMKLPVKALYNSCNASRKNICHRHYAEAAQYIAAEMKSAGMPLPKFEDLRGLKGWAYMTSYGIPPHIVDFVNDFLRGMQAGCIATERDICQFLNNSIRRYRATPLWPQDEADIIQGQSLEKTPLQSLQIVDNKRRHTDCEGTPSSVPQHPPRNIKPLPVKVMVGRPVYAIRVSGMPGSRSASRSGNQQWKQESFCNGTDQSVRSSSEPQITAVSLLKSSDSYDDLHEDSMGKAESTAGGTTRMPLSRNGSTCGDQQQKRKSFFSDIDQSIRSGKELQFSAVSLLESSNSYDDRHMDAMSESEPTTSSKPSSSTIDISSYVGSIGETDPSATGKYYLVQGEMLLNLFRFCPECGKRLKQSRLSAVGMAAIVRYVCPKCSRQAPPIKHWTSQRHFVTHNREKSFKGNVAASVAAITTGLRYIELQRWADLLNLSFVRQAFFCKVFVWTKRTIANVYRAQQDHLLEIVRLFYEKGEGLQLAMHARRRNRNSVLNSQAIISDARTKLVLHSQPIHSSLIGKQGDRKDIRHFLQRLSAKGLSVSSLTTGRFTTFDALSDLEQTENGHVRHQIDVNDLIKWMVRELRQAARELGCGSICLWIEHIIRHLKTAVEIGIKTGLDVSPFFNTCLMHVRGVHEWPQEEITGMHTRCAHPPLSSTRSDQHALRGFAYQKFRDVILNPSFQKFIATASLCNGVSLSDLKNVFDKIYRRKKIPHPNSIYELYTTMSVLHMNERRLAKMKLEIEAKRRRRKRNKCTSAFQPFTYTKWTDQILQTDLKARLKMLEMKWDEQSSQEALEMVKVDERYEID
ncbi:hypothetical protein V3C99_003355, partial [Haemonchus contortus]